METDFTNSWAVQKLADFLAGINTSDVEREVFDTAAEMAADALDAELGAIEGEGVLLACFGAGTSSDVRNPLLDALDHGSTFTLPGVGACVTAESHLDGLDGRLVLARRESEPFSSGELVLLRSMARALSMAVTSLRLLNTTREHERKFAAVIRSSLDCIVSMGIDGLITEWNPAAETTFGYSRAEAMGQPMDQLVIPERFREAHRAGLKHFLSSGTGPIIESRIEIPALRKDGTEFPAELAVTVVQGTEPRFTAYLRDISERQAATAHLTETTQRLSALVDSLNAAVVVETEERTVGLANTRFCEIFQCPMVPDELAGASCAAAAAQASLVLKHPDEFMARTEEIFDAGRPVFDDVVQFADGRTFERDHIPIIADGKMQGRLWVYRDVTARIEFEKDLAEARDNALAASRLKSSFLATMSHEIRTPMNGVVGLVDLLSGSPLNPQQTELVRMLDHSAEHLIGVIDDILDFSRIEAGELRVESIPFTPAVVINDVVQLFSHRAKKNDITLETEIAPELSGSYLSDPGRLRQILQNLIGNALKFTHHGSISVQAIMKTDPDGLGRKLHLSVSDTGIGIPPEICERLFEPFVQADASTARLYGGSGLGLSICHRLTDLMGGSIGVTSTPGSGSTFTVVLPLEPVDTATEAAAAEDTRPGTCDEADVPGRILVVEDNPVNQAVVEMQLERLGHEVVVTNGGRAALDELATGKQYDVILMDCQMPGMDGFTATGHIRTLDSPVAEIPIVAMTANALREDREACLAAGMSDYLPKPVRADDLKIMLDRWITKSRAARGVEVVEMNESIPVVDVKVLNQLVEDLGGDKSVLGEFTAIFLRELPKRLEAIQLQLPADDRHAMRERAHALRSPSRALGLARLDDVCERMERAALNGSLDEARSLERALLIAAEASVAELCELAPARS